MKSLRRTRRNYVQASTNSIRKRSYVRASTESDFQYFKPEAVRCFDDGDYPSDDLQAYVEDTLIPAAYTVAVQHYGKQGIEFIVDTSPFTTTITLIYADGTVEHHEIDFRYEREDSIVIMAESNSYQECVREIAERLYFDLV